MKKRILPVMAAMLALAGCGSSAPELSSEQPLFAQNGPALVALEEDPEQFSEEQAAAPEENSDLMTMTSEEEAGYTLFYTMLNENQFRRLLARDGVDMIPDRLVQYAEGMLAYFSSEAGDIVVCSPDFGLVKKIHDGTRTGRVMDARWLDDDRLLFLQGDEQMQRVYLYRPSTEELEPVYETPEGRQILGIDIDEYGAPVCILSAEPPVEEEQQDPTAQLGTKTVDDAAVNGEDADTTAEQAEETESSDSEPVTERIELDIADNP